MCSFYHVFYMDSFTSGEEWDLIQSASWALIQFPSYGY